MKTANNQKQQTQYKMRFHNALFLTPERLDRSPFMRSTVDSSCSHLTNNFLSKKKKNGIIYFKHRIVRKKYVAGLKTTRGKQ
jgi:hypothetical protein